MENLTTARARADEIVNQLSANPTSSAQLNFNSFGEVPSDDAALGICTWTCSWTCSWTSFAE